MRIAIAGPISTESVFHLLKEKTKTLPSGYGGAPFLGTLITAFLRKGHEVYAYTLDRTVPVGEEVRVSDGLFHYRIGPYRPRSMRSNGSYPGRIVDFFRLERKWLAEAIADDSPDVVNAHWSYEFAWGALESGVPALVTCHDAPLQVLRFMPNPYRAGRALMAFRVLRKADHVSVVSPYLSGQIQWHTKAEITVIPNPAPYSVIDEVTNTDLDEDIGKIRIMLVSNGWTKLKNVSTAMTAFSIFRNKYPEAVLDIFGSGYEEGGQAHRWALERGYTEGMNFRGRKPHAIILEEMRKSTLLLHPALEEVCCLALIEAMSVGLPVVAGDKSGGNPWLLDYGQAGVLVDVTEPESIAAGMDRLLSDRKRYYSISDTAKRRIMESFHPDVVVEEYLRCYQNCSQQSN